MGPAAIDLLAACIEHDPKDRPADGLALVETIDRVMAGAGATAGALSLDDLPWAEPVPAVRRPAVATDTRPTAGARTDRPKPSPVPMELPPEEPEDESRAGRGWFWTVAVCLLMIGGGGYGIYFLYAKHQARKDGEGAAAPDAKLPVGKSEPTKEGQDEQTPQVRAPEGTPAGKSEPAKAARDGQPPEVRVQQEPPAGKSGPPKEAAEKVKSKLRITLPQDDADLKIEGKLTKPTGTTREFETPALEVGRDLTYAFEAVWRPNNYTTLTRRKEVSFKGGADVVVVDLTKPDPKLPDEAVIRWVPTPDDVVAKMVEMARITSDDVVYEPGPGDGKVLIAAVKAGAKKAVGIEIDSEYVKVARGRVKQAGLGHKVTVIEGDALKGRDYSEASVVFLYMGNEFNNLLRPILEKQLKPGARIVSHRFVLGDWVPDRTEIVTGQDGDEYKLHIWTVKDKKP